MVSVLYIEDNKCLLNVCQRFLDRAGGIPIDMLSEYLVAIWEDNGIGIFTDENERTFGRVAEKNTRPGMFLNRAIFSRTSSTIKETKSNRHRRLVRDYRAQKRVLVYKSSEGVRGIL